jgi:acyl-CoA thioesterase
MHSLPNDTDVHQAFHKQIFQTLEQEPFAQFLGMNLIEIGPGTATAELEVKDHMLNSHGTVHGAILFSLADYVFAAASNSYGKTSVGLSTTMNFMAPAMKGAVLRATAEEEKRNHRTAWYKIRVESSGELLATMEALVYRKDRYFVPIEDMQSQMEK